MFTAHPGEIVGGLAVLTGEPSFFTIRVKHTSRIALISKSTFYRWVSFLAFIFLIFCFCGCSVALCIKYLRNNLSVLPQLLRYNLNFNESFSSFSLMIEQPRVVLHVAFTVVKRLSPFVRQVDFALDWVFLESGRALYRYLFYCIFVLFLLLQFTTTSSALCSPFVAMYEMFDRRVWIFVKLAIISKHFVRLVLIAIETFAASYPVPFLGCTDFTRDSKLLV